MVEIVNSDNVSKQVSYARSIVPQFVVEDHPKFVAFLKAYYKWSSSEGGEAALNYMKFNNDIDFVSESMMDAYTNLFAYNLPKEMKCDFRFFLKFLKQFYEIKGTDESYRILYRALFNEEVLISFPKRHLLIPSSAEWSTDRNFKIKYSGDGFSLRGKKLTGENKGYTCIVSDVIKTGETFTIFPQNETGDYIPNEKLSVEGQDDYLYVLPVYKVKSIISKSNWLDNDIIKISDDLYLKVDKINYGFIESVTISDGGTGYTIGDKIKTESDYSGTGFYAFVTAVGSNGEIESLTIKRTGFGYVNENIRFVGGTGTGFVGVPTWNAEFKTIKSASIILNTEKTGTSDITYSIGTNESITFESGVYTVPRFWKKLRAVPSTETARLHDSYYYQEFSYVLSSNANAKEQEKALKKLLQIAGLKMFIQQTVSYPVDYSLQFDLLDS